VENFRRKIMKNQTDWIRKYAIAAQQLSAWDEEIDIGR